MAASNVARFMAAHEIASLAELRARSVAEPAWFWDAASRFLQLEWAEPYHTVCDLSDGPEWARWFVGGRLNFAYNCVDRHAAAGSERLAVVWDGEDGTVRRWTYAQLRAATDAFAAELLSRGIGAGDVVALYFPMVPEAVAALLGVARIGAVALPLFSGYGPAAIAERLTLAHARALVASYRGLRRGRVVPMGAIAVDAAARVGGGVELIVIPRDEDVATRGVEPLATQVVEAEHPLLIAFTSGTTGRPKGCVHVHGGWLVQNAMAAAFQLDCHATDTLCWISDMGWIMGPWQVTAALSAGATLALCEGAVDWPDQDRLWRLLATQGVSILGLSPTLVRGAMAADGAGPRGYDLSQLRMFGSTGELWQPEPWAWLRDVVGAGRCPIINLSGGTEVGGCFLSPHADERVKPCSLGGPALGMAVDVADDDGRPLRGAVGELVCRAPWPSMTRGLLDEPERYLETYWSRFPGVWFHGDRAEVDADGQWFLHGRSDDTLKVAGKRLGPSEVETVALGHAGVAEAAAVGVPDPRQGEALAVVLVADVPDEEWPALCGAVREAIAAELGRSFRPAYVGIVAALPKTRSGKVVRRAVKARLTGAPVGDISSLEDAGALEHIQPLARG